MREIPARRAFAVAIIVAASIDLPCAIFAVMCVLIMYMTRTSRVYQLNEPMRRRLLKFIQMKNARPTMLASGTKPQ